MVHSCVTRILISKRRRECAFCFGTVDPLPSSSFSLVSVAHAVELLTNFFTLCFIELFYLRIVVVLCFKLCFGGRELAKAVTTFRHQVMTKTARCSGIALRALEAFAHSNSVSFVILSAFVFVFANVGTAVKSRAVNAAAVNFS